MRLLPALIDSLDYARAGGRISVIGVHSDPEVALPLNTTFVRALDIKFCGTANIVGRWDEAITDPGRFDDGNVPGDGVEPSVHGFTDRCLDHLATLGRAYSCKHEGIAARVAIRDRVG